MLENYMQEINFPSQSFANHWNVKHNVRIKQNLKNPYPSFQMCCLYSKTEANDYLMFLCKYLINNFTALNKIK